jgi:uncharacterized membrane protein
MIRVFKERIWLMYSLLAAVSWGLWGVLTKFISTDISPFVTHFLFTIGLLISLPFVIRNCKKNDFSLKGLILGIGSGFIAVIGNVLVYQSFHLGGQAAVVIPLTNLYPMITIIVGILVFSEKLYWTNIIGILLVLPAIILLSGQPDFFSYPELLFQNAVWEPWLFFSFLSLLMFGLFSAAQKVTTRYTTAEWSYLGFFISSVLVSVCFIVFGLVDFNFTPNTFLFGSMAGLLDGFGVLAIYAAYRSKGKAAQVSPVASSLQQACTIVLAVIFLNEKLEWTGFSGIILAILGAFLLSMEQKEQKV